MQTKGGLPVTYIIYIAVIIGLVAIDEYVKNIFYVLPINYDMPIVGNLVHFQYTENPGAAFGFLESKSGYNYILIIITSLLVIGCLIFLFINKHKSNLLNFSLVLISAGGLGNLYDRVFRMARLSFYSGKHVVVDFIYLKFINFAVFNVADSYVCVGAGLLCIYVLTNNIIPKKIK
jgi:signal peptidase II